MGSPLFIIKRIKNQMESYPNWFTQKGIDSEIAVMSAYRKMIMKGILGTAMENDDNIFRFLVKEFYLVRIMDELATRFPGACFVDVDPPKGMYKHWEVYRKDDNKIECDDDEGFYRCIVRVYPPYGEKTAQ